MIVELSHLPKPDHVTQDEARDVERQILELAKPQTTVAGYYDCTFHVVRSGDVWLVDHCQLSDGPIRDRVAEIICLGWDNFGYDFTGGSLAGVGAM